MIAQPIGSDLARRDTFVFDLDNTLYPAGSTVFAAIGARMTAFIAEALALDPAAALALQEDYHDRYGATVTGLARHHGIDASAFLDAVHDVDLRDIAANPALRAAIMGLGGRTIVYTNGARGYALRVLDRLGLADGIGALVAIEDVHLWPKPSGESFARMLALTGADPARSVMFEDSLANLRTARALGMGTVLVGPAQAPPGADVDAATADLPAFLRALARATAAPLAGAAD